MATCFDTCHAFALENDLSSKDAVGKTIETNFFLADRHEHIGLGEIGADGINAFLRHIPHRNIPLIMKTPIDSR